MKDKTSAIFGRVPTSVKKRFITACRKLKTTQQYVIIDAVDKIIKQAGKTT